MRIVAGVDCFPSKFPLKKKTFGFNKSDPGGFWFLKKSLIWGGKKKKKEGKGRGGLMTPVFTPSSWFAVENLCLSLGFNVILYFVCLFWSIWGLGGFLSA